MAERLRLLAAALAGALLAAAVAAGVALGAGKVEPTARYAGGHIVDVRRTPVVFVSLDEFALASLLEAPGRIDARRFPNFAALARQATWFTNATAVGDGTRWATPAVLAGRMPDRRRIPLWTDYPTNLFTLLGRTHAMHVTEPLTRLCPPSLCPGRRLPGRTRRERSRALTALIPLAKKDAARRSALADFIGRIRPWRSGRPPLYYLDVLLPHHPYVWLPGGRRYQPPQPAIPGLFGDNQWRRDGALVERAWQRYLLQVGYTDLLIGRLMRRLKATGLWERAALVVLPDHGVSFVPGTSRRTATPATVGGIATIPFFMKLPGQTVGTRVDRHVQTIDVLPTLAHALGLPQPRGVDGHSALNPAFRPAPDVELWSTTSVRTFGRRVYSQALVTRRLQEVLARQVALFGTGPFDAAFFRLAPAAGLVGRSAATLPRGSRRLRVALDSPVAGAPAAVSGRVAGAPSGRTVALVVGGRVAATTRTYYFRGVRFAAMVPRGGPVAVYAIG